VAELPVDVPLSVYRGDSWATTFRLLLEGDPPEPVDLEDATVEAWARRIDGTHVELVCTKGAPGEVTLSAPPIDVDELGCGVYAYDLEVRDNGDVTTWVKGQLVVEGDVTNAD
jgi:hypothetical protein